MRSLVDVGARTARFGSLVLLGLLAACNKGSSTYIDVTVFADTGLALESETITAKAPGKSDLAQAVAVASEAHLTVSPSGLADGTIVVIEAVGLKAGQPAVLDRAQVAVSSGHRVSVSLYLTAACSGVLACASDETCRLGTCMPIPQPVGLDAGSMDSSVGDVVGGPDVNPGTGGTGLNSAGGAGGASSTGGVGGVSSTGGAGGKGGANGSGGSPSDGSVQDVAGDTTPGPDGGVPDAPMGCTEGAIQSCGVAPFNKKGACGLDNATCTNGQWVGCVDTKGTDTCDTGNDNSCNGVPNEGCPCVNGATQDCGHAAVGTCKPGKSTCQNSTWGACVGNVEPASRDCTSANDNDCDGKADNIVDTVCKCAMGGAQSCGAHPGKDGNGPCKAGSQSCVIATSKTTSDWGACSGSVGPGTADTCDALNDNNCNGMLNEGCPCVNGTMQDCGHAAVGICKPGKSICTNSTWGACVGDVEPAARDCTSALDNDCDGKADNTVDTVCKCAMGGSQSCGAHAGNDGKGPCKAGTQSCVVATSKATSDWGTCTGAVGPAAADTCGATSDENCNGTFHDGCACVNGQPVACTCGSPSTCTNGVKGTCATVPTTQYTDADGDGYGKPGSASQQCPGAAGFSTNANDCDDLNASFHPSTSLCVDPNTSDQLKTCLPTGTVMMTSCSDGCFNSKCRSDGTIGLPGFVSCTASHTPHCTTAQGCNLDTGACGVDTSVDLDYLKCDGQNDCPAGSTCCSFNTRGSTTAACYPGGCPDSSHRTVCEPLAPNCTVQPSVICNTFADPTNASVCQ